MSLRFFSQPNPGTFLTMLLFIRLSCSSQDYGWDWPRNEPVPSPKPSPALQTFAGAQNSPEISGDFECSVKSFPFIVSILFTSRAEACAGTLLFPKWVLTAAHCFRNRRTEEWPFVKIQGGSSEPLWTRPIITMRLSDTKPQVRNVFHVFFPDDSAEPNHHNDIALIQLDDEFSLNDHLYTADLPPPPPGSGKFCTTALKLGWQAKNESKDTPSKWLHCSELSMVKISACGPFESIEKISDKILCSKSEEGGHSCFENCGGPLVCKDQPTIVIGIEKADNGCEEGKKTVAYTRVDAYLAWIRDQIPSEVQRRRKEEEKLEKKLEKKIENRSEHVPVAHVLLVVLLIINVIFH